MGDKKYTIQGKDYNLAVVTSKRAGEICGLFGYDNFCGFANPEETGVRIQNLGLDLEQMKRGLAICLIEPVDAINFDEIDLTVFDGIVLDFLLQRPQNFKKRSL